MAIHRQIGRQRGGGSVFHELGIERAADDHGGEAVFIDQLGERQRRLGQPVSAQTGHNINHIGRSRLQPISEFQIFAGRRNPRRPGLAVIGKFGIFVSEENGLDGFQRGRVGFPFHLKIRDAVRAGKRPGILHFGIRVHLGLAEAHIFIHGVGQVVIHVRIGEISIRTEIGQRIVHR